MSVPSEPVVAVVSLLHELHDGSAARLIGQTPVLTRTLERLALCETIDATAVLCWQDQQAAAEVAAEGLADVVTVGPRQADRAVNLVRKSQAWGDGWRGGPLGTCPADRGWHAAAANAIADATDAAFLYVVDASFAFLDPELTDALVRHAREVIKKNEPLHFTPAPPGLVGHLVARATASVLAAEPDARRQHPGRYLSYLPDNPRLDPIGFAACKSGPPWLTHAGVDCRVDDEARAAWAAHVPADADARALCRLRPPERQDVTIDLTTRRWSRPIWLADAADRDLSLAALEKVDVAGCRVSFAGVGDPLCHPHFKEAVAIVRERGATAVHVETDLLGPDDAALLVAAEVDVISVHLPAMTAATYANVMRHNGMATALGSLARLVASPVGCVVVPTFVKLAANVGEMEAWYDQWLRLASAAVLRGPDSFNLHPASDVASLAAAPLDRTDRQPIGRVVSPLASLKQAA